MLSTGHVIVCGLDHLGLRTIDELRMRDKEVVVAATRAGLADLLQFASTAVEPADVSPGSPDG
jgi:hypothetical protein